MAQVTQQRFLNSTVIGWTASGGWGETPSQLVVSLVDDPSLGDSFDPQFVGRPCTFVMSGFTFTGLLQSFSDSISTSGYTHEAVITDPREILEGVPLILDGYMGTVLNLPNLLNVFGYLESFGFGSSQKNETGIPWKNIRTAVHALTNLPQQGTFGGPIYYIQSRYIVDLSQLPPIPDDYRVGGDSISLLQFISEVCEAGGCDYYITMTETTTGIFVIQANVVSRNAYINYGAVTQFLSSFSEYVSKSVGRELANEVTSKFLVGGSVREMWYQYADNSINSIWQYWGLDINGNPNIGVGFGDDHQVVLDSRSVNNPRVGPWYITNVAEIRAVLAGRANWETFLLLKRDTGGIHNNKAVSLNIIGYTVNKGAPDIFQEILDNYNAKGNELTLDINKVLFPHTADSMDGYAQLDIETGYLYDFLYQIATEYYGKKFLVAIPYTYSAEEPDTGKIRLSQLPVESGFLDETLWPVGIQNNLLPVEVDRFTEDDGKIVAFVRFNDASLLDLSELNNDSVAFNSTNPQFGINKLLNYSVFVRCMVDNNVIFLDKLTRYGPRALITLDGVVHERIVDGQFPAKSIIIEFLNQGFTLAGVNITTQDYKTNVIDKVLGNIGQDVLNYGEQNSAITPDLAVIPLESQVRFYGPWSAIGIAGKMDYEKDDTLVPWNYGGFTALDIAANAKVSMAIGVNQQLEQGEITFPGLPFHSLGQPILSGGPLVSDISCSFGEQGVTTNYKFKRNVKQPRYGQAKAERVATIARRQQEQRRNIRLAGRQRRTIDLSKTKEPIKPITANTHPKTRKTSSHEMIVGQSYNETTDGVSSSVFIQSEYNFAEHAKLDYSNKAMMSLDGLFRPFSSTEHSSLPSIKTPGSGGQTPTVYNLNPFSGDNDVKVISYGQTLPSDLHGISRGTDYRGIALRGPLIVAGWGYDTRGRPVPNSSSSGDSPNFRTDYRTNSQTWKTGPVDLRWDDERALWAAGGGSSLIRATMNSDTSAILRATGEVVNTVNWLNSTIGSGDKVFLTIEDNEYCIVNQMYYTIGSLVSSIGCNADGTFNQCSTSFKVPNRISQSGPSGCPQS